MYSQNFALAIKHNGKVLREQADLVILPFGAEYSVYVKNLNSCRAQFTVTIDGKDATEGCRLILSPNDSVELERFIKGGDLSKGNRFRFIERTDAVEQHRGVGAEDGLVRVECCKERVVPPPVAVPVHHYYDVWHHGSGCRGSVTGSSGFRSFDSVGSSASGDGILRSSSCNFMQASSQGLGGQQTNSQNSQVMGWGQNATPVNDAGITVGGSLSTQAFMSMLGFPLEAQSVVLALKLRGFIGDKAVTAPITVSRKLTCSACGLPSLSSAQFCRRCGAGLIQY